MDEEKEDILQLIDKILVNGHVSNLEKFYLWEHLSELITASAEAEAPSLRLAPLKRAKSFLKTNPAYYTCRRRVMEIVRTMRSFLLNLENTPRIRTVVIIKGVRRRPAPRARESRFQSAPRRPEMPDPTKSPDSCCSSWPPSSLTC
jgi:hypothetical protein